MIWYFYHSPIVALFYRSYLRLCNTVILFACSLIQTNSLIRAVLRLYWSPVVQIFENLLYCSWDQLESSYALPPLYITCLLLGLVLEMHYKKSSRVKESVCCCFPTSRVKHYFCNTLPLLILSSVHEH